MFQIELEHKIFILVFIARSEKKKQSIFIKCSHDGMYYPLTPKAIYTVIVLTFHCPINAEIRAAEELYPLDSVIHLLKKQGPDQLPNISAVSPKFISAKHTYLQWRCTSLLPPKTPPPPSPPLSASACTLIRMQ